MLTAQQIVTLVCQICQCPGRLSQAGQAMNLILADYAQTIDLDVIGVDTILNISSQTDIPHFYALPSNYLRMKEKPFYNVQGTVRQISQMPLEDLDAAYTASGVSNYPDWYATDVSKTPVVIAFYPPPAVPLAVTCRYRPTSLDITTPESSSSTPFFPNQLTLVKEMCVLVGDIAGGDDRSTRWESEVARRMRKYLEMDDDKEGFAQTVKLDPRSFRTKANLPPSKVLGF